MIDECKRALPMVALGTRLGLDPWVPDRGGLIKSPFRADQNGKSFSVFSKDGGWGFKDHATDDSGDEVTLIMRATGKNKREAIRMYHDLAGIPMRGDGESTDTDQKNKKWDPVVATYRYKNRDRTLAFEVLRTKAKQFYVRQPAEPGEKKAGKEAKQDRRSGQWWIWTRKGLPETPLYHLPEILERGQETLYICEGEKDADNWQAATGRLATTCAGGAGNWLRQYTEQLLERRNKAVVICQDYDEKGRTAARALASTLTAAGLAPTIWDWEAVAKKHGLTLREKYDLSDFLEDSRRDR